MTVKLRSWLEKISEDPQKFSLHSRRRGGAFHAHRSNIWEEMIKILGNWASDAFRRYIDLSTDHKFQSMQAFVNSLL